MTRFPDDVREIRGDKVVLRAHVESDIPAIVANCNDARTLQWLPLPQPYGDEHAREFLETVRKKWEDDTMYSWAIDVDGEYAGTINLERRSPACWDMGYNGHPNVRGRGVMTAAARHVVAEAFDKMGLQTVCWRTGRGNWASRRVAWGVGLVVDATLPNQNVNARGEAQDQWVGHVDADGWKGVPQHPWWVPPVLHVADIRLRPWRDDDEVPDEAPQSWLGDKCPTPNKFRAWLLRCRERMAAGEAIFWCISDSRTDAPLGHVQLLNLDSDTGRLGYWLCPRVRRHGLLHHVLDTVREHAFAKRTSLSGDTGLGLHRLDATSEATNLQAARMLRRAGYKMWGEQRTPKVMLNWELLQTDDVEAQRAVPRIIPVIEVGKLKLRPWTATDGQTLPETVDEAAQKFMRANAQPTPQTFDAWLLRRSRFVDSGTAVGWCIADAKTDTPLGDFCIFHIGDGTATSAEVGYWLLPASRGRGILTTVMDRVVKHAFAHTCEGGLGLTRLHGQTDLDNVASRKVFKKAGFRQWGQDREAYTAADGTINDGAYFELLATDDRTTPAQDYKPSTERQQ